MLHLTHWYRVSQIENHLTCWACPSCIAGGGWLHVMFSSSRHKHSPELCVLRWENMSSDPSQGIVHAGGKQCPSFAIVLLNHYLAHAAIIWTITHCSILACQSDEITVLAMSLVGRLSTLNQSLVGLSCPVEKGNAFSQFWLTFFDWVVCSSAAFAQFSLVNLRVVTRSRNFVYLSRKHFFL